MIRLVHTLNLLIIVIYNHFMNRFDLSHIYLMPLTDKKKICTKFERDPGIIGLLGTTRIPRPYYGIICDVAMGLPPGDYTLDDIPMRKINDERVEVSVLLLVKKLTFENRQCISGNVFQAMYFKKHYKY
ncbi:hypothetical protein C2G38_2235649 [Gigaspora rosea]|uniref:Uncharacterized protein n=1 Tax=Gigaspora rosea TaxID=44941 RepID=A0A397TQ46_9GLOM|nr:hypothetical protein C2G38_2235649 [Gigaspora rosea]